MRQSGLCPDGHVLVAALQACAISQSLSDGKIIHKHISESSFESNPFVACSLVDMYVQCANIEDAFNVFKRLPARNVVLWNSMVAAYAQQGHLVAANKLIECMQKDGVQPNTETWNAVISGCSQNGHVKQATQCLQRMQDMGVKPNIITWNGMISGFTQHGDGQEALQAFQQMQQVGMEPNQVTYHSVLKACHNFAALNCANLIHAQMIEDSKDTERMTWNSVINMYLRCGSFHEAQGVFDGLPVHGIELWNSMIVGYANQNKHELALSCFGNMCQEGVTPDLVTLTSLLSACSHLGLVSEGCCHFTLMTEYGLTPTREHVNCLVDLLGRAGSLTEAVDLLWTMPFCPGNEAWRSLLTHCQTHSEKRLGNQCYQNVVSLDDKDSSGYVLMSRIHADRVM
ncbi:hypothetical protein KP509_16G000100 [Ceratopteris richardii]|uniref:Pentatricopeptide repeat-containing protein n=1 Tax=Ceratopteris richardii TaxID=49495 RepID=A0A8T2SZ17_CERRI|nr:hypothetical protein KP509_16G000100 [Ceratopteris richardii]